MPEPEATAQEPPAASAPEATIPMDTAPEAPAPTSKRTTGASANPEASSSAPPANDPDVVITRTEFVEPGRPTALAKCSARGDLSSYTDLSIGELVSGYISQVHKSRDAEIAMVNQIQHKSEVTFCCSLTFRIVILAILAPKSRTYT